MFLWSKDGRIRGVAMVKWEELCKSREYGGVGFYPLATSYEALMSKQIIMSLKSPDSTWGS